MIELQVIGGCRADGPCDQGSLSGQGFHVVTEVNLKDESVYDDSTYDEVAFSPKLIDKATGLPFMESIMTRFPTMDFTCPFCDAPTKVNGVTNMNGVAIETETAREISSEEAQKSKETMGESQPWDEPRANDEGPLADTLDVLEEEGALEEDVEPDEIDLSEDDPQHTFEETEEPTVDDSMPIEDDPIDPDDPIII